MKQQFFLTFSASGGVPKVTAKRPNVTLKQACVLMDIDIPDAYFRRPALSAKIQITDPKAPLHISSDAVIDAKAAIEAATGLNVTLEIVQPLSVEPPKK